MEDKGTKRIGLLIERSRAFGRELCEGIITYAQERGGWELRFLDAAHLRSQARQFDGFVARVTSDRIANLLAATRRPVVDVYYLKPRPGFAIVKTRHEKLGVIAAEHFLDRRFRNFAYCPYGGGRTSRYCQLAFARRLRRDGYRCLVYGTRTRTDYDFDDRSVIDDPIEPPPDARQLAKWLASLPKPVAVFTPSDLRAWQILSICRENRIDVPHEIAVLGLDNDLLLCGSAQPMLSSIDVNARRIGHVAAETLAAMIEHGIPQKNIVKMVDPAGVAMRTSTETFPVDPPWLSDALVYIRRNAKTGISASDVFARLGRSHTIVTKTFRETLGTTVQREIANARLDEAQRLLATTDMSVTRIAELSGFASVNYLLQTFTRAFGMPPGEWRERRGGKRP